MRIVVFAGGWSSEKEVSYKGAVSIQQALEEAGHSVILCNPAREFKNILSIIENADFAFVNIHGLGGEDGLIPALLESVGMPYQCSNPAGSFLALNKATAKLLYIKHNLPTSPFQFYTEIPKQIEGFRTYPLFVKANSGGSSLALFRVENEIEARNAIATVLELGDTALVEEAIEGIEISCGVLGERVLPPVLIRPKTGIFFDYESKYNASATEEICPAPLPKECIDTIMEYAKKAHQILGLFGYSRTDMIIQKDYSPVLLETNTIPGMTPTSLLPLEAQTAGISFSELLEILIEQGIQRHATRHI